VTGSALLAAVAGALGVAGAWEALARSRARPSRAPSRRVLARCAPRHARVARRPRRSGAGWRSSARRRCWPPDGSSPARSWGSPARRRPVARRPHRASAARALARGARARRAGGRAGDGRRARRRSRDPRRRRGRRARSDPRPAEAELRAPRRALALGEPTEAVLERLRRRAADPAWDTIVAAILLQREAGGDLASLLRATAAAQEEAERVEADARTASAQARFTAWLVTLSAARRRGRRGAREPGLRARAALAPGHGARARGRRRLPGGGVRARQAHRAPGAGVSRALVLAAFAAALAAVPVVELAAAAASRARGRGPVDCDRRGRWPVSAAASGCPARRRTSAGGCRPPGWRRRPPSRT
jgi:tight adherence protein B